MTSESIPRCYLCTTALGRKNASSEHVIPNALGGVLRSRRLLCVKCNGILGHEVDADLCAYVAPIGVLIGAARDQGRGRAVEVRRADGSKLLLDHAGRFRMSRAEWTEESTETGARITVTANTKKEAEKAFWGLCRKWTKKLGNVAIEPMEETVVEVDERMRFELQAGGPATNRGIAKIALGYYLHVGGERASVSDLIEFVRNGVVAPSTDVGWWDGEDVLPAEGDAMLRHVVAVRGSAAEGSLRGYVELFGTYHFAIVLAQPYAGPTVSKAHVLTLVDRKPTELDAVDLVGFPWTVAGTASKPALERGLTHVMQRANLLAAERRFDRMWGDEITNAIKRAMAACANGRTEIPMDELWPHVLRELQPFLLAFTRDVVERSRRRAATSTRNAAGARPAADGEGHHADDD